MQSKENRTHYIILRVTEHQKMLLKQDAKKEGLTISKLVRKLLRLDD